MALFDLKKKKKKKKKQSKKKKVTTQKVIKPRKLLAQDRRKKILDIYRSVGHTNITKTALAKQLNITRKTLAKDIVDISNEIAKIPAPEINFEFDVIKEYINEQARTIAKTSNTDATRVRALKLILEAGEKSIKVRQMLGIIDQPTQKHEIQANDFSTFYDEYFSQTKKSDKK
jgi:hypothetical protein|tara:strand:- start:5449 stop:5967 length:519 start_codon:yes stop_codon:yes gene_type:complete